MKLKFIFIALLTFLLSGCGFTKWITEEYRNEKTKTKTEVKTDVKENTDVKVTDKSTVKTDSVTIKALDLIEKLTEEWESRLKTYDTSKPVDPGTGTPPLASELIITNKNTADKKLTESVNVSSSRRQENDIEIDYKREMRRVIDSVMAENKKLITKTETETRTGVSWYWWMLIGAGIVVIIYLFFKFKWWKIFI